MKAQRTVFSLGAAKSPIYQAPIDRAGISEALNGLEAPPTMLVVPSAARDFRKLRRESFWVLIIFMG
tara:strand:- start:2653 stop:2853 length:201 start_codon:yes stop_codon:yes gene_type:complete